jgi:cysteine desulfurase
MTKEETEKPIYHREQLHLRGNFGNPSSLHRAARGAGEAVEAARGQDALLLGCRSDEIVFTSGGSEANNVALKGLFFRRLERPSHLITSKIEHLAVVEPCRFLERLGPEVTYLRIGGAGLVHPTTSAGDYQ